MTGSHHGSRIQVNGMKNIFIRAILVLVFVTIVRAVKGRLKFIILGDIGGVPYRPYSFWSQRLVSEQIAKISNVDFFVCTGDNFYFRGVKNADDFRFFATFERVYNSPSLQNRRWYMIAGNHDYNGNVSAQILYTKKSNRWTFPHYYYTKVFKIPKSNKSLQILMIDTMILCFPRMTKDENAPLTETQMEWIKTTVNNSKADYLIVVGHHPMFSAGRHGNNECLQDKLQNLFEQHKVNAYISGHDHNLQHIVTENSSLEYFVCGSANFFNNFQRNRNKLEPNSLKVFLGDNPGYLIVTAKEDKLKFEFRTTRPFERYKRLLPLRHKLPEYCRPKYSNSLEEFFRILNRKS